MDNPEKIAKLDKQDTRQRQINKKHNTIRKQTQIMEIRHEPSNKQLEVKTNRTSFLCGNRKGHHNTELRT